MEGEDRTQQVRILVHELSRRLDDHTRTVVADLGLTLPQASALRDLGEPLTTRELAERLSCEPSNATFVVDKLEKAGLVRREPHPTDRRSRYLVLTPQGITVRSALLERVDADEPLAHLTDRHLRDLERTLRRALDQPAEEKRTVVRAAGATS